MKTFILPLLLGSLLFTGCATKQPPTPPAAAKSGDGKTVKTDDLNEYDATSIADPLEPMNRATFWFNHQVYTYILHPVSKTYQTIVPKPVRTGVYNVFDNAEYPIRVINDTLQWNLKRAGLETEKFVVNSTVGVAGIGRPSNHIPSIADVPAADTGQTFAKWGIGHGAYLVLPLLGPSSLRDTVGLAGDYGLNPITWVSIVYGGWTWWAISIASTDTLRNVPPKMDTYDAATKNSLDRYLAARTAFVQYRAEVAKK